MKPLASASLSLFVLSVPAAPLVQPLPSKVESIRTLPDRAWTSPLPAQTQESMAPHQPKRDASTSPAKRRPAAAVTRPRRLDAPWVWSHGMKLAMRLESIEQVGRAEATTPCCPAPAQPFPPAAAAVQAEQRPGEDSDRSRRYALALRAYSEAIGAGRKEEALSLLKNAWEDMVGLRDVGSMAALAYLAAELEDADTAVMAAREAVTIDQDDRSRAVLVDVLLRLRRLEEAAATLQTMSPQTPAARKAAVTLAILEASAALERGEAAEAERLLLARLDDLDEGGLELLGWAQYRMGRFEAAASRFEAAYRRRPSRSAAQGLAFSLHRIERHRELLTLAEAGPGPLDDLLPPAVRDAIAAGERRFAIGPEGRLTLAPTAVDTARPRFSLRIAPHHRDKSGAPGEGRLKQTGVALTGQWRGMHDELSLTLERQRLDDGLREASGDGFQVLWQHRDGRGLGHRLGLGRSATGRLEGNPAPPAAWLGELGMDYHTDGWGMGVLAFRRPVAESLLSSNGRWSAVHQAAWGRVLETGLTLSGNRRLGAWDASAALTLASLDGSNVAANEKYELYGRALRPLASLPGLSLGPELILSRYQRNLSAYEFGHGGYFSPQRYLQLGALALYQGRSGQVDLDAELGIGHNWHRQAAAPGNPLTGAQPGKYPASTEGGLVYRARIQASWPLAPGWRVGGSLSAQQGANYSDRRIGLHLQAYDE
jgi:tetratricopeptide (TPR) repeat protein